MEPVATLVGVLASLAVKGALGAYAQGTGSVQGDDDWEGAWGSAVGSVLTALLATTRRTDGMLGSIDAKIDQLAVDSYRHPLNAAIRHLTEADHEWRSDEDRRTHLEQARFRLIDAAAAAPDGSIRATVEWHLALAWLLSGSRPDCAAALTRARDESFGALTEAVTSWAPTGRTPGRMSDLVRQLDPDQYGPRLGPALKRIGLRRPADPAPAAGAPTSIDLALEVAAVVQEIRRALGFPPSACATPRVLPQPLPDPAAAVTVAPAVVVDLLPGPNDVWGSAITVAEVRPPRHVATRWWTVDVRLAAAPAVANPTVQVLSLASEEDLYRAGEHLSEAPIAGFTPHQAPPAADPPGEDGSTGPVHDGWVTTLCRGKPTLVAVRSRLELDHDGDADIPRGGVFAVMPLVAGIAAAETIAKPAHRP
ncbi:hypothetical protein [Pseudonocardia sp.]|uniref:hypothetical protein n=1 Tax=Pseudonocardia sp. TaxID=60912 RepID=UPI003D0C963C